MSHWEGDPKSEPNDGWLPDPSGRHGASTCHDFGQALVRLAAQRETIRKRHSDTLEKICAIVDRLAKLRKTVIGEQTHFLDEDGQTVAIVTNTVRAEVEAELNSTEPTLLVRTWRAGWTAGYEACLSAHRASPSSDATKD